MIYYYAMIRAFIDTFEKDIMAVIEVQFEGQKDSSELAQAEHCVLAAKSLLLQLENTVKTHKRVALEKEISDCKTDIDHRVNELDITQGKIDIVKKSYARYKDHLNSGGEHGQEMVRCSWYVCNFEEPC